MTTEEIICMAREADLLTTTEPSGYQVWIPENLEKFANLVAAAEREACAALCDRGDPMFKPALTQFDCADLIRARGQS